MFRPRAKLCLSLPADDEQKSGTGRLGGRCSMRKLYSMASCQKQWLCGGICCWSCRSARVQASIQGTQHRKLEGPSPSAGHQQRLGPPAIALKQLRLHDHTGRLYQASGSREDTTIPSSVATSPWDIGAPVVAFGLLPLPAGVIMSPCHHRETPWQRWDAKILYPFSATDECSYGPVQHFISVF